jgi:hypothetical protein
MEKILSTMHILWYFMSFYRQMRGEELEGLNVDELQQLEKNLESGLHRVLQTKVYLLNMMLRQFP